MDLQQLNPQQLQIVHHHLGPALVIAGAGTGKTRVITHRVARLIQSGIDPAKILMLTFTNKAAEEMASRVAQTVGDPKLSDRLQHGTFHSVANRFLRKYAPLIDFGHNFTIFDESDQEDLIKAARTEIITKEDKNFPKAGLLADLFSLAFSFHCTAQAIRNDPYESRLFNLSKVIQRDFPDFLQFHDTILHIFRVFREKKVRNNAMDFDDLLERWLEIIVMKGASLAFVRDLEFILVDEYQDTNIVQEDLLNGLSEAHRNIMVVGDDAQSIYRWRGAHFRNIMEFPKKYNAVIYPLDQNYRSTPEILAIANASINHNKFQFPKALFTQKPRRLKPQLFYTYDTREEAQIVIAEIRRLQDLDLDLSQMAVLYRNHLQCGDLQIALTEVGIPYIIRSGIKFFDSAHIKDIISFLRVVFNPLDELAWLRILKMVPNIGNTKAHQIYTVFRNQNSVRITQDNHELQRLIPPKARENWEQLRQMFSDLVKQELAPAMMIHHVFHKFYQNYMESKYDNSKNRANDIQLLIESSKRYRSLERFLIELSLAGKQMANKHELDDGANIDAITLTSIHQAKGLEWDAVFVIGLTQGQLPHQRNMILDELLEEERRLFYVAMTRAKQYLTIIAPMVSPSYAGFGTPGQISDFIKELPKELFDKGQSEYSYDARMINKKITQRLVFD